jgi:hypothetical protein
VTARPAPPCGTVRAYWRHKRRGEPIDQPCRYAHSEYRRNPPQPRPLAPCGTDTAYSRHRKRDEPPCDQCKQAHADRVRLDAQIKRLLHQLGITADADTTTRQAPKGQQ